MNSIYEQPHAVLKPTPMSSIPSRPLVPDVSMVFNSEPATKDSIYLTYKAWKERDQLEVVAKTNVIERLSNMQKKLRFNDAQFRNQEISIDEANKKGPSFDQMYLDNLPNRHLNLSIVEPPKVVANLLPNKIPFPKQSTVSNEKFKTLGPYDYNSWSSKRDALDKIFKNDSNKSETLNKNRIIDLYNYRKGTLASDNISDSGNAFGSNVKMKEHICKCKQGENNATVEKTQDGLLVRDLLKIIQQNNEQMLILQKQVATLINNKEKIKEISSSDSMRKNIVEKRKPHLSQISLDVMTSFELSIRHPTNTNEAVDYQQKISDVTEVGQQKTWSESILDGISRPNVSLSLNEQQLHVPERCPSPINSIKVDMKEYSSYSSDENEDIPEWTFYNNIMVIV
ncbi:hypothetical protein FQA39_LY07427 [Lamprigera yunnana]|nr:hypothetical protein FQA39_LY07427 [Lamprigera yunnana]